MPVGQTASTLAPERTKRQGERVVDQGLRDELKAAIPAKGWTQRRVAEALGMNEANLSGSLNGQRPLGARLARRIADLIGLDSPALTNVSSSDREIPLIALEELPMDVSGPKMAAALRKLTKQRLPAMTGDRGLFYVLLKRASGWYPPNTIVFIAPNRKLVDKKRVLAALKGHRFVARYRALADGGFDLVSRDGVPYPGAEVLGRIVGHLSLREGQDDES